MRPCLLCLAQIRARQRSSRNQFPHAEAQSESIKSQGLLTEVLLREGQVKLIQQARLIISSNKKPSKVYDPSIRFTSQDAQVWSEQAESDF